MCVVEKILAFTVHSMVHASPIFTYESEINPLSPPHYPSTESVTPKGNPKPHGNPPNPVPKVPADPD